MFSIKKFLRIALFPLFFQCAAYAEENSFMLSYYNRAEMRGRVPSQAIPYLEKSEEPEPDSGWMLLYQHNLFSSMPMISFYGGMDLAKWVHEEQEVYTYSSFASCRAWLLSLFIFSPYIEVSFGGPTFITKTQFQEADFGTHFIFQHFLAVGVKCLFFTIDCKFLRYTTTKTSGGFTVPLMLSLGGAF